MLPATFIEKSVALINKTLHQTIEISMIKDVKHNLIDILPML